MSASAFPQPALRPYLSSDLASLYEIRLAAIDELTVEDYDEAQREAWLSRCADEEALGQTLERELTLIALIEGSPVGFISLKNGQLIDQLYVEPAVARRGVASALLDAIEKLSAARGAAALLVDASDTAKPFFDARGFSAVHRNTIEIDGIWLGNTHMSKTLPPISLPVAKP
ncbi:MAG TPA: GNAT family N-acetyltransferase [Methylocella sp.]|nr:GNAT family N-acetyltransferase [Methylocella sp.]